MSLYKIRDFKNYPLQKQKKKKKVWFWILYLKTKKNIFIEESVKNSDSHIKQ